MKLASKKHIPLFFLILISAFWSYFYQASFWLNEYGEHKPEWLLLIDGLIVLPLLCFLFIKDKKEAAIKAALYSCLVILLGSYVIPESSKSIWHDLELGRYVLLFMFLTVEIIAIATAVIAIKTALLGRGDPELAISVPIAKFVKSDSIQKLLTFEVRMWTFLFFSKHIQTSSFAGDKHFSCHQKDGTQSNLLGFILIIAFELPIMHVIVHFTWSALAANVLSILTIISLAFFFAEYKAIAIRPISTTPHSLVIRYGIWNPLELSYKDIETVEVNNESVRRAKGVRRFNLSGVPNVKIALKSGEFVYLGLDNPLAFIDEVQINLGR